MEEQTFFSMGAEAGTLVSSCFNSSWSQTWVVVDHLVLITGLLANVLLLILFLRDCKTLNASQLLGINQVVMNLIFLTIIPADLIQGFGVLSTFNETRGRPDLSSIVSVNVTQTPMSESSQAEALRRVFNTLILIGTPLLLTFMCVERHLAVSRPVLYMKMREMKYRVMVCAVVWVVTVSFSVASWFLGTIQITVPVSIIIAVLFVVMLSCLGTMMWSLGKRSPAHESPGSNAHDSPQKRQAVQSLLIVVVSATLVYLPVLVLFPLILYIHQSRGSALSEETVCNVFMYLMLFPQFGVLIGPLFFFSKAKQMFKLKKRGISG